VIENFFPEWSEVDWSIPEEYERKGITWPLSGHIGNMVDIMFGWQRCWPHLPWFMEERDDHPPDENMEPPENGSGRHI